MIAAALAWASGLFRSVPPRVWLAAGAVLLAAVTVLWYGQSRYAAGVRDADARWEAAATRLVKQAERSASEADRAEAPRLEDHAARVAEEKERVDEALDEGRSPFDVLFPSSVR